jgi:hypothetical protein
MDLLSAAMWSVNFCTSFLIYGGCIWRIALILSELASIPLVETRYPNTLPRITEDTLLRVEFEVGFTHIGEGLCQV